ncbi:MAG TPA: class II aldolase/adducin family protein [Anaerolineales bacterium]|nr:class II aldolase/adducin family protein [Anaerolineales bacterium]HRQ93352.1 class II aldolase/adducin family protein [Anaerolineales bacterium]
MDRLSTTYGHLWGKKGQSVAAPRAVGSDVRDLYAPAAVRQALLDDVTQAAQLGLSAGHLGEASVRLKGDKFLVTAAGSWFQGMQDADLLLASETPEKGFAQDGLPAAWRLHLAGYRQHAQAGASLLAQPAATLALMASGHVPDARLLHGAIALGDFVLIDAEAEPTPEVFSNTRVTFVKNVGVLVLASTLQQAISDLHLVNRLSEISVWQTRGSAY